MKFPLFTSLRLSRDARLGIAVATLVALSAIALDRRWFFTGLALAVVAIAIVVLFSAFVMRPARIPHGAILTLRFADGLREDAPRSPLEQLRSRGAPTLFHLREALTAAATDPKLKAVLLEISGPGIGLATAQELHDLLRAIAAGGKRVIAVLSGDNITVHDYLLACGADEIVANPDSAMMMLGVAAGGFFLKDALANLGVEAQTLQWKEYKGAAETFTRNSMSPQVRESLEALISDWSSILAAHVAAARKLDVERARELLGAGFSSVATACDAGLLDRAGYLEDLRDELSADLPPARANDRFVSLGRYLRHLHYQRDGRRNPCVALVHALGPVVTGDAPLTGEFMSGERLSADLRRAARDDRVRAIVLRVNSPGGSAVGSDLIWRAVREAQKRGKPVVVSMGDVAASGGYYVAMGADAIVAEPATITGSIGVVYTKFSISNLLRRLGVSIEAVKSVPIGDALSIARPMTDTEFAQLNHTVEQLYANFTGKVADGRKLTQAATEEVARGRVWSGVAAKARGLVDELGGLDRAIRIAREKAGIADDESHDLIPYPAPSFLASLSLNFARAEMLASLNLNFVRTDVPAPLTAAAALLEVPPRWAPALLHLLSRGVAILQLGPLWR
ncbi:MAG TPA: signal peptide peptidase SppA [Candidatus Binataceae bacterium]|nr:signal peptide peptidase SppA [Candidatus Binataceae bacterium]